MSEPILNTVHLNDCLDRWRRGDFAGRDELVRSACSRLEPLVRRMLRQFPNVRQWEETGDVMQSALMRLLRSLEAIRPASTRDFFNLAALHIRRTLLDLARHYRQHPAVFGDGRNDCSAAPGPLQEAEAPADGIKDLDRWQAFHEAVEALEVEGREVVSLIYYHRWKHAEVAELLQISERTVRRRWVEALNRLRKVVGIEMEAR